MTKILTVSFAFLLSGCVAVPIVVTGIGVTGVAVQETTGRGLTDHAVSTVNDQDCRISRAFKNEAVCQDPNIIKLQVTTTGVKPSTVEEIQNRYR